MTIKDYLDIAQLVIWAVAVIIATVFSNVHFKNKKADRYRDLVTESAKHWVSYYDKQALENPEKINGAINDIAKDMTAHGYKIGDQRVNDIKAIAEYELTKLRMEQAKAGVDNTVKPNNADLKQDVKDSDIVTPVDQLKQISGGSND